MKAVTLVASAPAIPSDGTITPVPRVEPSHIGIGRASSVGVDESIGRGRPNREAPARNTGPTVRRNALRSGRQFNQRNDWNVLRTRITLELRRHLPVTSKVEDDDIRLDSEDLGERRLGVRLGHAQPGAGEMLDVRRRE